MKVLLQLTNMHTTPFNHSNHIIKAIWLIAFFSMNSYSRFPDLALVQVTGSWCSQESDVGQLGTFQVLEAISPLIQENRETVAQG